jgi:plastocyanin
MRNHVGVSLLAAAGASVIVTATSCSSSNSSPSPNTPTFTIANNTVTPKNVVVTRGSQVTFVNNDTVSHNMASDPHPEHTDCPEINQVGVLSPGQSRQTGNMTTNRPACGFHDHDQPTVVSLQGTITIQ